MWKASKDSLGKFFQIHVHLKKTNLIISFQANWQKKLGIRAGKNILDLVNGDSFFFFFLIVQ